MEKFSVMDEEMLSSYHAFALVTHDEKLSEEALPP
jgi:hypothetical protein